MTAPVLALAKRLCGAYMRIARGETDMIKPWDDDRCWDEQSYRERQAWLAVAALVAPALEVPDDLQYVESPQGYEFYTINKAAMDAHIAAIRKVVEG